MNNETFDVLVVFKETISEVNIFNDRISGGQENRRLVIKNAYSYGLESSATHYFIRKNDKRIFIPKENVLYIGAREDIENG